VAILAILGRRPSVHPRKSAEAWIERLVERSAPPPYISAEEWRLLFWIEERQVSDLA